MEWKCNKGHIWKTSFNSIKKGSWCSFCHINKIKLTIEECQKTAVQRDGECLTKKYNNASILMEWKCSKGHIWKSNFNHIKRGSWCPYCANNAKLNIEECRTLAIEREG